MTLDEKALEIAAKRLCMEAMGGDNEQNHSRIALAWGMRADRYRNEAQAAITAYLSALSEKGVRLMPREANDAMWDAGDRLFPALNEIGNGIEEHGEDVLYEVIPGPGKIWEAMFDAHSEPKP